MSRRVVGILLVLATSACAATAPASDTPAASTSPTPVQVATLTPATGAPTAAGSTAPPKSPQALAITEFKIGAGQGPHDVAPAVDGGVWYTAQRSGELGWLDPDSGEYEMTKLGTGSAPHGVIVGPDGNAWVTDGGLNSIVRVDAKTKAVTRYALPADRRNANLNTATFDRNGTLWFTGQNGIYGKLDPRTGAMAVFDSPRGRGPYGIATCADGSVYYASLASSFIGRVNVETGTVEVIEPTTAGQGARRVWCDSKSNIWVSEWNVGSLARYCSTCRPAWTEWKLPGVRPMAYAVYVDEADIVWITDFGANALVRFDPATQTFTSLPHSAPSANVRQLLGRAGEVWGALSGQDKLMVVRTR